MTIIVFLICFAASTIGGICGIGGGVVIKPLLDAFGIMPVSTVSFLSGVSVLSMSMVNIYKNRNSGELDRKRSIPLGIGAACGGILGKRMFTSLKSTVNADEIVGSVQAVVLGLLVLGTLIYVINKRRIKPRNVSGRILPLIIGLLLGICSSFLGIGGGPMNLAVLYYFFAMDTKEAAVNSILIILLSQCASLGMTISTHAIPEFRLENLFAMVAAGISGGFLSARLHKKLTSETTDRLFIFLLCVILCICIFNSMMFTRP